MHLKFLTGRTVIIGAALIAGLTVGTLGFSPTLASAVSNPKEAPDYPKNENGQSYGSALYAPTPEAEPDLVLAVGDDGTVGYVLNKDLNGTEPKTPEEAVNMTLKKSEVKKINLYDADGETVIGEFSIHKSNIKMVKMEDQPNEQ